MKKSVTKKLLAVLLTFVMAASMLVGCGGGSADNAGGDAAVESKGTIMWLSNLSSGAQYEAAKAYAEAICANLGYKFVVVYGDSFNDPDGNLNAVKNAMTSDVVAIVASQDGGIKNIMDEYPELYVAGYNTDMAAVYGEGGVAADLQQSDHFLGTICDGYYDGTLLGQQMANAVIEKGYEKVSTIIFPVYAYPNLTMADIGFRAAIEEYNKTAEKPVTIVGDTKTLEFSPLEESYFLEDGNGDLDAIVAFCAGVDFVYPTMKSAMANGACSADTKLLTAGFNTDESLTADVGGEGVIQMLTISPNEDIGWSLMMVHKAVAGEMFADYTANERINSIEYVMDSQEDIQNVLTKSLMTGNVDNAQISVDELVAVDSYEALKALFASEQLYVDALAK